MRGVGWECLCLCGGKGKKVLWEASLRGLGAAQRSYDRSMCIIRTFHLLALVQVQGRQWEVAKHLDVSFRRWCVCEWGRTEKLRRFMISGEVLRVRRWAIARPSLPVSSSQNLRLRSVTVFGRSLISPDDRVMYEGVRVSWKVLCARPWPLTLFLP